MFAAVLFYIGVIRQPEVHIERKNEAEHASADILEEIAREYNEKGVSLTVNYEEIEDNIYQVYISDKLEIMVPVETFVDKMNCSVNVYANGTVTLEKGDNKVKVYMGSALANINGLSTQIAENLKTKMVSYLSL